MLIVAMQCNAMVPAHEEQDEGDDADDADDDGDAHEDGGRAERWRQDCPEVIQATPADLGAVLAENERDCYHLNFAGFVRDEIRIVQTLD